MEVENEVATEVTNDVEDPSMIRIGTLCYVVTSCLASPASRCAVGKIVEVVSLPSVRAFGVTPTPNCLGLSWSGLGLLSSWNRAGLPRTTKTSPRAVRDPGVFAILNRASAVLIRERTSSLNSFFPEPGVGSRFNQ